jgi:hypothetical protein
VNLEPEISEANIADRVGVVTGFNLLSASGTPLDFSDRPVPVLPRSDESYQELLNRMHQVLVSAEFFVKTKLKQFILCFHVSNFWDTGTEPNLRVTDRVLYGTRKIYLSDFWQMTPGEFLDFQTGVAAEVIIAACKKYKLDDTAAQELTIKYPLRKIEFSLISYEPTISLTEPPLDRHFSPLTNAEFTFPDFNLYQWCVSEPFTQNQLQKIGTETLTVCAPVDLPVDQYIQIANAMHRAPLATLRIHGWGQGNDLRFLKYFQNLSRLSIDVDSLVDLNCLRSLSTELVHLELILRSKTAKYSLDALEHFDNLQSLKLLGYCEDLSRFPKLTSLKALMLSEISLKNFSSVSCLPHLQSFVLADSKLSDLSAIANMTSLKYLGLARLPKLLSMPNISELEHLEYLHLIGLTKLTAIGCLTNFKRMRRLSLNGLKNLTNLTKVNDAPNLEELLIFNMKNATPASLSWIQNHKTLKAFRTDNVALEKAVGLKRGKTGKDFEFSSSNVEVASAGMHFSPAEMTASLKSMVKNEAATDPVLECVEQDGEDAEKLSVHIKIDDTFGDNLENEKCNDIEDQLEEILVSESLGRWSGHEIGADFYDMFFVGENSKLMFEALNLILKEVLPIGSYVEFQDRSQGVVVTKY